MRLSCSPRVSSVASFELLSLASDSFWYLLFSPVQSPYSSICPTEHQPVNVSSMQLACAHPGDSLCAENIRRKSALWQSLFLRLCLCDAFCVCFLFKFVCYIVYAVWNFTQLSAVCEQSNNFRCRRLDGSSPLEKTFNWQFQIELAVFELVDALRTARCEETGIRNL